MSNFITNEDSYNSSVLKQNALIYFGHEGPAKDLVERFEEGTNKLFYESPDDIYAYMSLFFKNFIKKPVIGCFQTKKTLNPHGAPGYEIELFCNHLNDLKCVALYQSKYSYNCLDDIVQVVHDCQESIRIVTELAPNLSKVSPYDQLYVDKFLIEFYGKLTRQYDEIMQAREEGERMKRALEGADEDGDVGRSKSRTSKKKLHQNKDKTASTHSSAGNKADTPTEGGDGLEQGVVAGSLMPGLGGKGAISELVCQAAALLSDVPLYQYISNLFGVSETSHYTLPIPMVTAVGASKVRYLKEYLLMPSPSTHLTTFINVLSHLMPELNRTRENQQADVPAKTSTNTKEKKEKKGGGVGGEVVSSSLNEIETVINHIKEAVLQAGCELGRDFFLALDCNPLHCYQQESGTYELNPGEVKSADEVRGMLVDLVTRYPYIICLIDPLHLKSKEEWGKLCSQISSNCYVIASEVFEKTPCSLLSSPVDQTFLSSGIMLPLHECCTLSEVWNCAFNYKNTHPLTLVSTCDQDSCSTFIVDLAVAMRAIFLRLGDLGRVEKTCKYNRLLSIHNRLESKGLLCQEFFQFSQVGPEWVEEEKEEEVVAEETKNEEAKSSHSQKKSKKNKQ